MTEEQRQKRLAYSREYMRRKREDPAWRAEKNAYDRIRSKIRKMDPIKHAKKLLSDKIARSDKSNQERAKKYQHSRWIDTKEDPEKLEKLYQKKRAWYAAHREQQLERQRKRRSDPAYQPQRLEYERKKKYNLSPEQMRGLLVAQENRCAICRSDLDGDRESHVDHNHATGNVRGILCHKCNTGIGLLGDTSAALFAAYEYLKRSE